MKKRAPWLWLLLIPAQAVADVVLVVLGLFLDSLVFSHPSPDAGGHGFPALTLLFFLAAAVISVVVLIVSLVGFFIALHK